VTAITVESLFDVDKGHQLDLNRVEIVDARDGDAVAYVARSHRNNGVTAWVSAMGGCEPAEAGAISVCLRSRNHSLSAFVQPRRFYTTYHVAILRPRRAMTLQEKLWWCLCIRANRFRFNFGRQANRTIGSLPLPSNAPSWALGATIPSHTTTAQRAPPQLVSTGTWRAFPLDELFSFHFGKYIARRDLKPGETPLVTASARNNGISAMVDVEAEWQGGQITVANNGSVGAAFYQPRRFAATRDVTVLEPKKLLAPPLSAAEALFICTMLRKESVRFNYSRKWSAGRMAASTILLPAKRGEPDRREMARIMANLCLGWVLDSKGVQ